MSQENVELIQRAYEEFDRARQPPLSVLDPEVEWHTAADLPDSGVHRGHDGVSALIQEWVNSFEDFRAEVTEFIDRDDYVVVPLVLRGRIRGSDEEVALPETHLWKVRNGKVVECASIGPSNRPSKPPGCGSRQCRETSRSCAEG
jgi:ketosteroid isomerase-like protein